MDYGASSYRRFLAGDDSELAEVIRLYKDGLMFYINGYVHDISMAQDLTEDVFFKLAVKKPHFREEALFKTWLYTIGRNLALNRLKKLSRHKECSTEALEISSEEELLEERCLKNERNVCLYRAMAQLNVRNIAGYNQKLAELRAKSDEKAREDARQLASDTENKKAAMRARADARLGKAAALIVERVVNG